MKNLVEKHSWADFRSTGLLLIINQILHIFGWAIVFNFDEDQNLIEVYPARVKYRGFDEKSVSENYLKITQYLHREADDLMHDVLGTER